MKIWQNLLLSPEGDSGGGGQDDGQSEQDEQAQLEANRGGDDGEGEKGEKKEETEKPTGLTKDDITDILSRVVPAVSPKPAEEKKYTPEEIEKLLNVWKPDASFLKKMGFAEPTAEHVQALHELRDNLIKQANTMAEARIQQLLTEREKEIEELRGYVSEQRAAATTKAFYEANPELQAYEEVVEAVSAKLESQGFKAPTQQKVFEEIAKTSREVLARMNVKVEKGKVQKPAGSRMANLSGGGQSGGEKGTNNNRKKGMEIFDEEA